MKKIKKWLNPKNLFSWLSAKVGVASFLLYVLEGILRRVPWKITVPLSDAIVDAIEDGTVDGPEAADLVKEIRISSKN